ncbi:MAG TPA: CotH kinase family protein [Chitinophagaceae bacterium]|nr:CotH kinase family protein [Chitinophagaceae bacterium]
MRFYLSALLLFLIGQTTFAQTFSSTINQTLSEGNTHSFAITTSGLPTVMDNNFGIYEVSVNIQHMQCQDIKLYLSTPTGAIIDLMSVNGTGSDLPNTKFRIYANESIRYANSPLNKAYMPLSPMISLLDGQNPNGNWTLYYEDIAINGFLGTLQNWSIQFKPFPAVKALDSTSTNIPILKINTPIGYIPNDPKTPGTIRVFDNGWNQLNSFSDPTPSYQFQVGIETQGYTSAGGDKPNYDFEIQNVAGLDTSISIFGLPAESDFILKSCYTDDYMMKDPLTFAMSNRMGFYAPRTRYVEIVVNNQYAGLYILMEKVKRDSNRVAIAKLTPNDTSGNEVTGGYIFEINPNGAPASWYSQYQGYQGPNLGGFIEFKTVTPKPYSIHPNQLNYLHNFVDTFEQTLMSANYQDPVNGWRHYADENSAIDFMIVSEFSTNYDTYGRSSYMYKDKITDGNKIHFAPPWDSDRGYCCVNDWVHIVTHGYWEFPFWWSRFRSDSMFAKHLNCRYTSYRRHAIPDSVFTQFIDTTTLYMQNGLQRNVARWQNYWLPSQYLKYNVLDRLAWMDQQLSGNTYFPPLPMAQTQVCTGNPVDIFIGSQYTYNFKPGPDTSYFVPQTTGQHEAIVSTEFGCKTYQTFTVNESPITTLQGINLPCANASYQYSVTPLANASYIWSIQNGTATSGCLSNTNTCTVTWNNAATGSVTVKQTVNNLCFDIDTMPVQIKVCTQLEEESISQFEIYPNPSHDIVYLSHGKKLNSSFEITLINSLGEKMIVPTSHKDATTYQLDISTLPAGVYHLSVKVNGKQQQSERILKY